MADDDVQIRTLSLNGACELRIAGELDMMAADALAERTRTAVEAVPGPVLVDLSGLTFIDLHGARALDEMVRALADGRPVTVRCCPPRVRRVLNLLGLTLDAFPAGDGTVPQPATPAPADEVRRVRLDSAGQGRTPSGR